MLISSRSSGRHGRLWMPYSIGTESLDDHRKHNIYGRVAGKVRRQRISGGVESDKNHISMGIVSCAVNKIGGKAAQHLET